MSEAKFARIYWLWQPGTFKSLQKYPAAPPITAPVTALSSVAPEITVRPPHWPTATWSGPSVAVNASSSFSERFLCAPRNRKHLARPDQCAKPIFNRWRSVSITSLTRTDTPFLKVVWKGVSFTACLERRLRLAVVLTFHPPNVAALWDRL